MTLKELSTAIWTEECKRTRMPPEYVPKRNFKENSANELTKSVIAFLKYHGWQAERISNMGRYIDNSKTFTDVIGRTRKIGSGKYIKGSGTNGTADISATIRGRSCKIEIKYGKDRQSDVQKQYQADIERAGGIYVIVKDWSMFTEWYYSLIKFI